MRPRDIHEAARQLIDPKWVKLHRDDTGRMEWQSLPSLWTQLEDAVMYSGGSSGSPSPRSRLPISATVVDLMIAIAAAVQEAVQEHCTAKREKPLRTVPDKVRAIASALTATTRDDDQLEWWTDALTRWAMEARAALRLDPDRPRWARGQCCPDCGADSVSSEVGGDTVRTPALAISWVGPDDDQQHHADTEWKVRAVECRACGQTWWRGTEGLEKFIEQVMTLNLTKETLGA